MVKVLIDTNLIQACTALFQAKAGDLNYVPWIDVNKDGIINMRDYEWFILHAGQTIDVPADQMPAYQNSWTSHWKAAPYWLNTGNGELPPTDDEIKAAFNSNVEKAIGAMSRSALDHGYTITVTSYNVAVSNKIVGTYGEKLTCYQVSIDCAIFYSATIPAVASPLAPLILIAIAVAIILLGIGGYNFLTNLNRPTVDEHTTKLKFSNTCPYPVTVTLPDGSTVVVPAGSSIDYEKTEKTETPNNWGSLIGMAVVAVIGIVTAVYVIPLLAGGKKRK